jgi:2-polyprenyl-3-methyl-5-hydroxy-6-metoxy-1,4-benzoquinol methylase
MNLPGKNVHVHYEVRAASRLHLLEATRTSTSQTVLKEIISSQQDSITKLYSHIRFRIIPLRFLQEIGQYIPNGGRVLDIGCGFGLFTLYFAAMHPETRFLGIDLSSARIEAARASARHLGLRNAEFACRNAISLLDSSLPKHDAVVTLDVLHHLPVHAGNDLLNTIYHDILSENSLLVIKDITTRPRAMLYFTFLLDLIMNPRSSFYYRSVDSWLELLAGIGFSRLEQHYLWDILPYPHVLIVGRKDSAAR